MKRILLFKILLVIIALAILAAACTIPFVYESPSLFYKTGIDKIMLRTGKILGILAAVLMVTQLVFISRFAWFESLFTMKRVFNLHRIGGLIILAAAIGHPVFILWADHFVFFPFNQKYWPEFVGILLLILLTFFVLISYWQKKTGLPYKTWRWLHKCVAPILFVLLPLHVINVSRSFESGVPFWAFAILMGAAGLLFLRKLLKR